MEFALFVLVSFAMLIGALMAIGRWYPGSGAEQLDWRPTRSEEDEVRLELEDIEQMLELQNQSRRRKGRPELTEAGLRAEVEAEERERRARAERYRAVVPKTEPRPSAADERGAGSGEREASDPPTR